MDRLECPVVFAVNHLRVVLHLEQRRVAAVCKLVINHVDRSQHALLTNWHSLVVYTGLVSNIEVALAHIVALHQVRLN